MQNKSLLRKLYFVMALSGALAGYFTLHQFCIPAETALRLSEAALMLEGQRLYIDLVDNAWAFYLYLNFVPVLISRATFVHPIAVCNLLVTALFMLAASSLVCLTHAGPGFRNPVRYQSASGWFLLFGFSLVTVGQLVHFAQANQIFFLCLCPYIVLRAGTLRGLKYDSKLSLWVAVMLALAVSIDFLYLFFVLLFEICMFCSLYPFARFSFVRGRFVGPELTNFLLLSACISFVVAILPGSGTNVYVEVICKLNYLAFLEPLMSLNYFGCAPDQRAGIFFAILFLSVVLPLVQRNVLVRVFAIASVLGFGLMILQGATLSYQSYLFFGFACMAAAAGLGDYLPLAGKISAPTSGGFLNLGRTQVILSMAGFMAIVAVATYFVQVALLPKRHYFNLADLGYYGLADRRDLAIFSEVVEENSKVRESVAIIGLQVRPAYPVITQLRRRPGLCLNCGFLIDVLDVLEQPIYASVMERLRPFKKQLYADLAKRLGNRATAPGMIMVESEEVRRVLEENGVFKVLEDNYTACGGVSMEDESSRGAHPAVEKLGYNAGFTVYRRKPVKAL
ncbi:MAG: hypothetical protein JST01_06355 [Cyanobacteria bacterium SZAS TMP-1]|nr:hypothetical protein [Cyanobacteria bacterium SZAS TMP-1]